jgi:Zn-dependent peptidase ImmA (M78 family)
MSAEGLLSLLNEGRKKLLKRNDVICDTISLSVLKQVDKVFERGLAYYQDFSDISSSHDTSIFFRKKYFATDLNFESMRIVHKFEQQKFLVDGFAALAEMDMRVSVKRFEITDDAKVAAETVRSLFMPKKRPKTSRDLLKAMISACADNKIIVFEFIESWNKKSKTNIDGFYLNPNMIVLKRQKSYKREIFTLAHEIGHCLLGAEEVEHLDLVNIDFNSLSNVEHWCNDFAFYLIAGDDAKLIDSITSVGPENDYCYDMTVEISNRTFISRLAIYTRFLIDRKVSPSNYAAIKADLIEQYNLRVQKEKETLSDNNSQPSTPKPILSPLFIETMQMALFKGIISETQFCKYLNVKPSKMEKYLW